ncbi:DUF2188 domain-containing protein [Serpentinicella sp. ANB-PHB4]|uniref:DUF2188 domain-containing protein n=1 Tax=Serpentinicella sp. ANB-PHB4 TaxID=3074076 RepID=UPI0028545991|nr:DUF2188 domain-containing protein [Serpentinicella sp. ANB-PHB4]MDR5659281.1 DUF2188 domain-containing protein [Serpentinicella sp. ANB-PHB4]
MAWDKNNYPDALKNLEEKVRDKAIEIANSLVEEGYGEGNAVPIAIAQAKRWAGVEEQKLSKHTEDDMHLIPHRDGWAIKKENADRASHILETKKEAEDKAREIVGKKHVNIIIHRSDGTIERTL